MQVDEDEITNVKNIKDRKQIIVEVTEDEKKAYFEFLKKNVPKSSLLN
jgi:methyl coenzyme M reductase beta subunit